MERDDELSNSSQHHSQSSQPEVRPTESTLHPLLSRVGAHNINDTQLMRILQGQQLTTAFREGTRPPLSNSERLQQSALTNHHFPLSTAAAISRRRVNSVFLDTPPSTQSSMSGVIDAIRLMAQRNSQTRRNRWSARNQTPDTQRSEDYDANWREYEESQMQEPVPEPPITYDGTDERCSICADHFIHDDSVCRLRCRHVFHSECWERNIRAGANAVANHERFHLDCPNCRGAGTVIALWRYIDPERVTQVAGGRTAENDLEQGAEMHDISGQGPDTPRSERTRSSDYEAQNFVSHLGHDAFHVQTRLANGRTPIIVDPGSVGNLCGDRWAEEVANAVVAAGLKSAYSKRPKPLRVSGVGAAPRSAIAIAPFQLP